MATTTAMPETEAREAAAACPYNVEFLRYVRSYIAERPRSSVRAIVQEAGGPDRVGFVIVDVIVGFCQEGALSSPRVGAIVGPIRETLLAAHGAGVRRFITLRDSHSPQTPEFQAFPPHCIAGTRESELVPELASLPFAHEFVDMPKNSLHPMPGTSFASLLDEWLAADVSTICVVGDVTDMCVYNAAMAVRLTCNALDRDARVVVPTECVQTYDLPVRVAEEIGALPHDGDLMHDLFLYHLAINRVELVQSLR